MTFRSVVYAASVLLLIMGLTSCGARDPALKSVQLVPNAMTIQTGETVQLQALGTFQKGSVPSTRDVSTDCKWISSNTAVATVSSSGLVTGVTAGTTSITASYETSGVTAQAAITVTKTIDSNLQSITIIPADQTLNAIGETAQFLAIGTFGGSPGTAFLTSTTSPPVTWASSVSQVATIDSSGLATTKGVTGTTNITASAVGPTGTAVVGTAALTLVPDSGPTVPTLTVVKLGGGASQGLVVSSPTPIYCGNVCQSDFPFGSTVTLTATPAGSFRGWSSNCTPVSGTPNACTTTMPIGPDGHTMNVVVGAIFDPS